MILGPRAVLILAALLAPLGACGPSVQAIYEGNVRFEHCVRLDLDREIAPSHRHACWSQWVQTYSYGQTRDRVEYAKRRLRYLAAGETSPPGLDLSSDAGSGEPTVALNAPNPTDLHSPPPTVVKSAPPAAVSATEEVAMKAPAAPLPHALCGDTCAGTYRACVSPCYGSGTKIPSQCVACEKDYQRCMQRCFK